MKYVPILLILAASLVRAEDGQPVDVAKLLTDLSVANAIKDTGKIDLLLKDVIEAGQTSKETAVLEAIAKELNTSWKVVKGNWGTMGKIIEAQGYLGQKPGLKLLKKIALQKKAKTSDDEVLQGKALLSLGMYRDPRNVDKIADMCKHKSMEVAKAAYQAYKHYGPAKGKVRKKCAEVLMKRLDMEYPSAGGQGSGNVSAEQQERWAQLSPIVIESMQAVCRQPTINDINNWREWWKENKKSRDAWKDEES